MPTYTETKMKDSAYYEEEITVPETVRFEIDDKIKFSRDNMKLEKKLPGANIVIQKADKKIILFSNKKSRKYKRELYTTLAHIKNMIAGLNKPFLYCLKVCSGHFPMSVKLEGNNLIISNFLGEKIPRRAIILPDVKLTINGDQITVESHNLEAAGQTAANIERATVIRNRDRRIFQDGIYITEKPQ